MMRRFLAAVALLAFTLSLVVPAGANVITRTDGNDTPGPLDLSAISVAHRDGRQIFTFTTFGTIYPADVNGDNGWFEVDFDVDGDKEWEQYTALFWADGKLRGVYAKAGGGIISKALPVGKSAANRVWVSVPIRADSYDFAAFSVHFGAPCTESKPCVDAIPDRYPLIRHDLTPPTIRLHAPGVSTKHTSWLTIPVEFRITDDLYGSGVRRWVFEKRVVGTSVWDKEAGGTSTNPTVKVDLKEGRTYEMRVTAWDGQGNRASASTRVSVPTDDSRPMFTYTGGWDRLTDVREAFLRTLHTGAVGTELKVSLPGTPSKVCVLEGPTTGPVSEAEMYLDGEMVVLLREHGSTYPRNVGGCSLIRNMGKTVSLKIVPTSSEPFVFDGIVIKL